jgi:hypothetical protein
MRSKRRKTASRKSVQTAASSSLIHDEGALGFSLQPLLDNLTLCYADESIDDGSFEEAVEPLLDEYAHARDVYFASLEKDGLVSFSLTILTTVRLINTIGASYRAPDQVRRRTADCWS